MAWTANLGGQIHHGEIRGGSVQALRDADSADDEDDGYRSGGDQDDDDEDDDDHEDRDEA
jgi:hypothetical protein